MRQGAAQRWIEYRSQILQGNRPYAGVQPQLQACDQQLRVVRGTESSPQGGLHKPILISLPLRSDNSLLIVQRGTLPRNRSWLP